MHLPESSTLTLSGAVVAEARPCGRGARRLKPAALVLLVSTATWVLVGLASFAHSLWFGLGEPEIAARISLIEWGPWIVLSPVVMALAALMPIRATSWKWALPVHVVASVGVALAHHHMTSVLRPGPRSVLARSAREEPEPPRATFTKAAAERARPALSAGGAVPLGAGVPRPATRAPLNGLVLFNPRLTLPIYWLIVAGVLAWRHHRVALEREGRAIRAEGEATRARLAALQAQLQPHFLFNSLNAIAAFITRRPAAAEEMVCALSDLLRRILRMSDRAEIPLREELEFARGYLAVHRIRFEDTLTVRWEIGAEAGDALVPTLLLQPLIENALEHGLRGAAGEITIGAEIRGARLVLHVTDRAARDPAEGPPAHDSTRLGLRNTRERLTALFGADFRLDLILRPAGARAEIELPRRTRAP